MLAETDQTIVDPLFDCATLHIQAGVMVARPRPFETIVMAIVLEQQKQLEQIQRLLEELRNYRQG